MVANKIDIHTHCFLKRQKSPPTPWNPQGGFKPDHRDMRTHLESLGIYKAIALTNASEPFANNEAAQKICQEQPDFFSWFCNFRSDEDPAAIEDKMASYKEKGAVGVGELSINQWIDSPLITSIFTAAEKLELPVTFHMSPEPGYSYGICDKPGLPYLEMALKDFPNLKLLGHSQTFWLEISGDCPREGNEARSGFGSGPVTEGGTLERLFRKYPNLYGDLSANSGYCAVSRDRGYGISFMEEFSNRLMFGTDTVMVGQVFPLASYLDSLVSDGSLSRETYDNICHKNAQRILNL